ncbi:prenyltransferase/squalene oxidase repeat-containing protein [Allokutzneria sp. NRRL B-24872]|uniref:prenyltransferase/squalene oxidase repeat-containing protein n=1 Tax=Allokutzneria sp. NRRL B-24872 TaxID=1137961 RepID=UPI000A3CF99B|nr:prenyltransferase/squalene oxidase repeat-containing protein [Allokutzneria sp. NRRL B-24872]
MFTAAKATEAAAAALRWLQGRQLPDGSIVDDPETLVFQEWDTVNALKAIGTWHRDAPYTDGGTTAAALEFLRHKAKPGGMLSWGVLDTTPDEYCTETSSEYVSALTMLDREDEARVGAEFLCSQQLPEGPWAEVHSHIPKAFQTEPSVTGFALQALLGLDMDPPHLKEALDFLVAAQRPEGHFGINWYYYGTHYYLMRPAVAALAEFGHHAAVAAARDFTLSDQRSDGSWFHQVEGFGEYSSPEQHTALALGTLAHARTGTDHPAVRSGLAWLLERQRENGSWDGGSYPYPETSSYASFRATQHIFTTAQVLSTLKRFAELEAAT